MMKLLRRRIFFLNTKFQVSLMVISVSYVLFGITVLGIALFFPVIVAMERSGYTSAEAVRAADLLLYLHSNFWTAWVLVLVIIVLHSVRTSHRIAGPIYRITQVFERLKKGLIPKPLRRPRKGDYLVEEIGLTNEVLESLRERVDGIKKTERQLRAALSQCREIKGEATKELLLEHLEAVAEKEQLLASELEALQIEP